MLYCWILVMPARLSSITFRFSYSWSCLKMLAFLWQLKSPPMSILYYLETLLVAAIKAIRATVASSLPFYYGMCTLIIRREVFYLFSVIRLCMSMAWKYSLPSGGVLSMYSMSFLSSIRRPLWSSLFLVNGPYIILYAFVCSFGDTSFVSHVSCSSHMSGKELLWSMYASIAVLLTFHDLMLNEMMLIAVFSGWSFFYFFIVFFYIKFRGWRGSAALFSFESGFSISSISSKVVRSWQLLYLLCSLVWLVPVWCLGLPVSYDLCRFSSFFYCLEFLKLLVKIGDFTLYIAIVFFDSVELVSDLFLRIGLGDGVLLNFISVVGLNVTILLLFFFLPLVCIFFVLFIDFFFPFHPLRKFSPYDWLLLVLVIC